MAFLRTENAAVREIQRKIKYAKIDIAHYLDELRAARNKEKELLERIAQAERDIVEFEEAIAKLGEK